MIPIHRWPVWWALGVVGLVVLQIPQPTAHEHPSLPRLHQQLALLHQHLTALRRQVMQGDSALHQQLTHLQEQLDALQARVTAVEQAQGDHIWGVVDAHGTTVGTLLTVVYEPPVSISSAVVAIDIEGSTVVVLVERDRFSARGYGGGPRFESPDCSGPPWLVEADPTAEFRFSLFPTPQIAVSAPGQTVYILDPAGTPAVVALLSAFTDEGTCAAQGGGPSVLTARPAIALLDLLTLFTPPFSVR